MNTRALGSSGIEASVVGLGTWVMGGWMWGGANEADAVKAIHAAIDAGITLVDTAPIYGFGLSEEIVGKALADRRDEVVLASKCGMVCESAQGELKFRSNAEGPDPDGHIVINIFLGPESIRREVENSLKRLQTDTIDLYQTHWQESTTAVEDTMSCLLDLKQEGKIRAIGVSNASTADMDRYRENGQLDSDQELFSMLDRGIQPEQLPYCREHNIAVLAYSPLAQGLLTGKMPPERDFEEGDQRRTNERFSVENRRRVAAMLEEFKPVAEAHDITLAQLAIAWTVHQPGLTHALCGARNPRQARENAAAGDVVLSESDLRTLNGALEAHGPGIV